MRWSIRSQIMLPVALLVLVAVLLTSLISAYSAAKQSELDSFRQLQTILATLGASRFPLSDQVLQKMKGLAGAEFVAIARDGEILSATTNLEASTVELLRSAPHNDQIRQISQLPTATLGGRRHFLARVPGTESIHELYVLYPEGRLRAAQWNAIGTPLIVGTIAAGAGVLMSLAIGHRLARLIRKVQEQLSQISTRHFVQLEPAAPVDELFELQIAANRLSQRLVDLEGEIVRSERLRLLAQLAGGIAHHLRNAITGAKLAVQLHCRRCTSAASDGSLDIAERQLSLTEEQIKGLLTLGFRRETQQHGDLAAITAEVDRLMSPIAKHVQVHLKSDLRLPVGCVDVADADAVRAAIVNLVSNAIEAAGNEGSVIVRTSVDEGQAVVEVADSGAGPPSEVAATLFDPFVTTKPEGVGLGLSLAREAAEVTGGKIEWYRRDGLTVFRLQWPMSASPNKQACKESAL